MLKKAGYKCISIHAPAWGATFFRGIKIKASLFQSTLPRGERLYWGDRMTKVELFQSTLPRGERPCSSSQIWILDTFQSTLPRGERLQRKDEAAAAIDISIHAPAWGATIRCRHRTTHSRDFNPRSRVGSDVFSAFFVRVLQDFNPRSRVGSDRIWVRTRPQRNDFNPRSRVGSDQRQGMDWMETGHFNPRSRVGSDKDTRWSYANVWISIHAPAWGATAKMHKFYAFLDKITIFRELNGDFAWF